MEGASGSHGAAGNNTTNSYNLQRWMDEKPKEQPWFMKQQTASDTLGKEPYNGTSRRKSLI